MLILLLFFGWVYWTFYSFRYYRFKRQDNVVDCIGQTFVAGAIGLGCFGILYIATLCLAPAIQLNEAAQPNIPIYSFVNKDGDSKLKNLKNFVVGNLTISDKKYYDVFENACALQIDQSSCIISNDLAPGQNPNISYSIIKWRYSQWILLVSKNSDGSPGSYDRTSKYTLHIPKDTVFQDIENK